MMRRTCALATLLALSLAPTSALAQRCSRGHAGVPMAVPLTLGEADFGNTPSPCSDLRVGLDVRGGAIIDTADFYGFLSGEAVLSANIPVARRVWVSGSLAAPRFRYAPNATLVGTDVGVGASTLGVHVGLFHREGLVVSTWLRVLLPTDSVSQHSVRTGLEPGVAVLWQPRSRVSVMGSFSVPVQLSFLGGRGLAYGTARASVDAGVLVGTWFEPTVGVEARVGNDPDGALEYLAARLALRFHLGRGVGVHLSGLVPLAGLERTLARGALGVWVGW
jgi:hypothetical protein